MCPPDPPGQTPLEGSADLTRLAGALAHDINNHLTAILGYANLVAESLDDRDPRQSDLTEIIRAAQEAGALSRELLMKVGR